MALYGVDLHSQGKKIVLGMQLQIKRAGPLGIRRIEFHLRSFDHERAGTLLLSEAHEAMNASGLFPSLPDLQALYKNFQDKDSRFNYVDFVRALRPGLSERASSAVSAIFARFGVDPVPMKTLEEAFQPEASPLFRGGAQSAEEARGEFCMLLRAHTGAEGEDGAVSEQAWSEFYADMRLCLPDDDYLVQQLEASWGAGEDARLPSRKEVDECILLLRSGLIQQSKGIKDEVNMRKFIRQYNTTESVVPAELYELMLFVGMNATPALAKAVIDRVDLNKSGSVGLQQLVTTICEKDPRWGE